MSVAPLAESFESHRSHLLSAAYRLTGSVSDAEDAVQDAWLRLAAADTAAIRDLRAWLTTVVDRICLDRLRSATARRERYVGQWPPEPIGTDLTPSNPPDPLESVVRQEANRMAAMVVLDALSPAQRVAFVLHDGFAVPFDEIAGVLSVNVPSARQLASRARRAVAAAPPPVPDAAHAEVVTRLLSAMAAGDLDAVVAALHPYRSTTNRGPRPRLPRRRRPPRFSGAGHRVHGRRWQGVGRPRHREPREVARDQAFRSRSAVP
ncbi:sigma-70 family RNA polymerase sigma factor [Rhodococcus sp. W8901]|uniref:sigma-70 family RNA polymerase sigma factor n=1 Tax=Rhodococcus sp. W8901 TaxID=2742603 RepID=UPI0015816100|nr:sigma-70 family RNA polymerase sigma factor [Rhodococcus sp. W8901]